MIALSARKPKSKQQVEFEVCRQTSGFEAPPNHIAWFKSTNFEVSFQDLRINQFCHRAKAPVGFEPTNRPAARPLRHSHIRHQQNENSTKNL